MKKVLILYNDIQNYRVEAWNHIAGCFQLDVAFSGKDESTTPCVFNKILFTARKIGPFFFVPRKLHNTFKNYDVIVFYADLHYASYCILPFLPRKYKTIPWTIGFGVSYSHPYRVDRKHTFYDWVYKKLLLKCDAILFYMEKAKEFWANSSFDFNKVFIATNTVRVKDIELKVEKKKDFLFVGTLYAGKGLDKLIDSFAKVKQAIGLNNKLHIVGKGDQRDVLEQQVNGLGLQDDVIFHGAIYDEEILSQLFAKSVLCISPIQAGLTAPKSLGYGTPFVCRKDAITGGEMYHVTNGVNGIFYEKDEDLYEIMKDAVQNPKKYQVMCLAAKKYYDNNATPVHMAQGVIDAINYALSH